MPVEEIVLFVNHRHAPYVLTKPFHTSQKLIKRDHYGITISLKVQHNFELEKDILGLGDGIKVIAPPRLKRAIRDRLRGGIDLYNTEISDSGLLSANKQLIFKGYTQLNFVYTQREIRRIKLEINKYDKEVSIKQPRSQFILKTLPSLKNILINHNLLKIIHSIDKEAFIVRSVLFDSKYSQEVDEKWRQSKDINTIIQNDNHKLIDDTQTDQLQLTEADENLLRKMFIIRIYLDDISLKNGPLKLIPGSHKKVLSENEVQTITDNSTPVISDIPAGGIQILKPLLLVSNSLAVSQKRRRILQLEFSSVELKDGFNWYERKRLDDFGD